MNATTRTAYTRIKVRHDHVAAVIALIDAALIEDAARKVQARRTADKETNR